MRRRSSVLLSSALFVLWSAPALAQTTDGPAESGDISAPILSASLVHFGPEERAALWERLAAHLSPTGRIIVEVHRLGDVR